MGDATAWIGIAGAVATVMVAGLGGLFAKFNQLGRKIDGAVEKLTDAYDDHEREDQRRHEENVQRLTRLETLVNGNGFSRRH